MKRYFCLLTLMVALAGAPRSLAQKSVLPEQFASWKVAHCVDQPEHPVLSDEVGEREYRACQFASGANSVTVSAGRYRDPSSAYEVYTSLLSPGMQPSTLGQYTAVNGFKLLALAGDVVMQVEPPQKISTPDLQQLLAAVRAHAHESPLPPIRAFLPKDGLISGSQRYALGTAGFRNALEGFQRLEYAAIGEQIGFGSGAEAMLAEYHRDKESALLLLIDYPTPQLAELHLRHIESALPDEARQRGTPVERRGSLLSLVLAPTSARYAEDLRAAVNYETQVTWNEASQAATDPPWSVILYRIFVGTGAFMILAVIFGVMFGGLRVFVKRLLPGKVFDRPKNIEVLQLGLSGKTIDPSDFY